MICFQLFQDYYTFKKRDLKKRSYRSSSEIDGKLKLEPKVKTIVIIAITPLFVWNRVENFSLFGLEQFWWQYLLQ